MPPGGLTRGDPTTVGLRTNPRKALSAREQDVLRHAAEGYTDRETAESLGISIYTVRKHRATVLLKFNARTMAQAVHLAGDDLDPS